MSDDVLIETKFMRKARPRGLENVSFKGIPVPNEKKIDKNGFVESLGRYGILHLLIFI